MSAINAERNSKNKDKERQLWKDIIQDVSQALIKNGDM